jgi:hypothetical protein
MRLPCLELRTTPPMQDLTADQSHGLCKRVSRSLIPRILQSASIRSLPVSRDTDLPQGHELWRFMNHSTLVGNTPRRNCATMLATATKVAKEGSQDPAIWRCLEEKMASLR